jgi:hypothetical protein
MTETPQQEKKNNCGEERRSVSVNCGEQGSREAATDCGEERRSVSDDCGEQGNRVIANQIRDISREKATREFQQLANMAKISLTPACLNKRTGMNVVDFFTFEQRLATIGNHGISFFYFLENLHQYEGEKYIQNMVTFYKTHPQKKNTAPLKMWYRIFSLYFGSINIFKPLTAIQIYQQFQPQSVLDPTMGWGGRLVGAAACDVPNYIGIDMNTDLEKPYEDMIAFLREDNSGTKISVMFQDALTVDYSLLEYDMVFTSPPYYNREIYQHSQTFSTQIEWETLFYIPLFTKTMDGMQLGGHYCLNVPHAIYKRVCVPLWGECHQSFAMQKSSRTTTEVYKEHIYVWRKP